MRQEQILTVKDGIIALTVVLLGRETKSNNKAFLIRSEESERRKEAACWHLWPRHLVRLFFEFICLCTFFSVFD